MVIPHSMRDPGESFWIPAFAGMTTDSLHSSLLLPLSVPHGEPRPHYPTTPKKWGQLFFFGRGKSGDCPYFPVPIFPFPDSICFFLYLIIVILIIESSSNLAFRIVGINRIRVAAVVELFPDSINVRLGERVLTKVIQKIYNL